MFVDHAKIYVSSGHGGSGCVSFLREKFMPKGGPDGGDGGRGGDVIILGDPHMRSLLDFRGGKHFRAGRGQHGKGSNRHGKSGKDVIIKVPPGTMIYNAETDELIGDIQQPGDRIVVAKGGRGGKGNARYASSTNQAPRDWQVGGKAEEYVLRLELKLIADIGVVGFPNAGKSTLLSRISDARPKIADYPFTTLKPNLGVVKYHDFSSFVMADIPGLIEGAHRGKGLGFEFLRHIERTRALLFLIDAQAEKPREEFETLLSELENYDSRLSEKPRLVVLSKSDVADETMRKRHKKELQGLEYMYISSVVGEGLAELKERLWAMLEEVRQAAESTEQ